MEPIRELLNALPGIEAVANRVKHIVEQVFYTDGISRERLKEWATQMTNRTCEVLGLGNFNGEGRSDNVTAMHAELRALQIPELALPNVAENCRMYRVTGGENDAPAFVVQERVGNTNNFGEPRTVIDFSQIPDNIDAQPVYNPWSPWELSRDGEFFGFSVELPGRPHEIWVLRTETSTPDNWDIAARIAAPSFPNVGIIGTVEEGRVHVVVNRGTGRTFTNPVNEEEVEAREAVTLTIFEDEQHRDYATTDDAEASLREVSLMGENHFWPDVIQLGNDQCLDYYRSMTVNELYIIPEGYTGEPSELFQLYRGEKGKGIIRLEGEYLYLLTNDRVEGGEVLRMQVVIGENGRIDIDATRALLEQRFGGADEILDLDNWEGVVTGGDDGGFRIHLGFNDMAVVGDSIAVVRTTEGQHYVDVYRPGGTGAIERATQFGPFEIVGLRRDPVQPVVYTVQSDPGMPLTIHAIRMGADEARQRLVVDAELPQVPEAVNGIHRETLHYKEVNGHPLFIQVALPEGFTGVEEALAQCPVVATFYSGFGRTLPNVFDPLEIMFLRGRMVHVRIATSANGEEIGVNRKGRDRIHVIEDIEAALRFLQQHGAQQFGLYGVSNGGLNVATVGLRLASQGEVPVRALCMVSPITNLVLEPGKSAPRQMTSVWQGEFGLMTPENPYLRWMSPVDLLQMNNFPTMPACAFWVGGLDQSVAPENSYAMAIALKHAMGHPVHVVSDPRAAHYPTTKNVKIDLHLYMLRFFQKELLGEG